MEPTQMHRALHEVAAARQARQNLSILHVHAPKCKISSQLDLVCVCASARAFIRQSKGVLGL